MIVGAGITWMAWLIMLAGIPATVWAAIKANKCRKLILQEVRFG